MERKKKKRPGKSRVPFFLVCIPPFLIINYIIFRLATAQPDFTLTIGDAGFMSICTLVTAIVLSLILETLCEKKGLKKLEPFAMPLSMFGAMGVAVVLNLVLPEAVTAFTWWGNVA